MDEIQINGGDSLGDDFYEKIEAPKFVDLTAPDRHRPDNDDRHWFCLRVGCDQKHEEEMDSETIYKNFVLRVMAARSPNVRLRKALYGKDPSSNVKCPLTVPAKSSKSRVSRLAFVSSISQKMVDGKMKGRNLFKQCETPEKKEKQSSVVVATALTTPRNKKRLSNLGTFRSIRNPKPPALAVPKNRMVGKAMVFHSPKKTVRVNLKKSMELSVRKLCGGMKKLEIASGKKDCILGGNKPVPLDSSRKRFKGREVKSRVYDSLRPQNCLGKEAKSSKRLKKKNEEKELELHCVPAPCEDSENESSGMEIQEKSRNGFLKKCSTSDTTEGEKGNEHEECLETPKNLEFQLVENKGEAASDTSRSEGTSLENCKEKNTGDSNFAHTQDQNGESNKTREGSDSEEQVKSSLEKGIMPNVIETDENEYVSVSDNKDNECEVMNVDDKENALASNDNRTPNPNTSHVVKKKILGKHESFIGIRTVTKGMTKTFKGNSTAAVNCAEGVSYRKPKFTNPKPFRLRTDERQILKEANSEKKLHLQPLKETTSKRIHHNAVQRNEKCLEQTENASHACDGGEKESGRRKRENKPQRRGTSCPQTPKATAERKRSTTPQASRWEFNQEKLSKKSPESLKRTKSLCMKQKARTPRGIEPSKKETLTPTTPCRLGVIKESSSKILRTKVMAKPMEDGTSPATKASTSSAYRPSFRGRKPAATAKEPHFHNVHVPKSCARRVA